MKKLELSLHYIQELNYRIAYTILGTTLLFIISYLYKQTLIYLIIPKGISHFISTDLTEIFTTYMHLCAAISLIIGTIIFIIQFYIFLIPGLYLNETKKGYKIIIITICFYLCIYTIALPIIIQISWEFFLSYTNDFNSIQLIFDPQLKNYLKHIYKLSIIINLSYPFLIILNILLFRIKTTTLTKHRRIIYFTSFTVAAILTPPDVISQAFIGLFFILFYEIQIILWIIYRKYNLLYF
ncbi:unnamed protein product [Sphacelaria rigidula]